VCGLRLDCERWGACEIAAGGSALWFDPKTNVGFGYTVTGFAAGYNGDQNRLGPIFTALMKGKAFAGPKL